MKVMNDGKHVSLIPVEVGEEEFVASVAANFKHGEKIRYGGRRSEENEKFVMVRLHVQPDKSDEGFLVKGSTEDDKYGVNNIRNICYFRTNGLIFLDAIDVDGKKALRLTASYCKHCNAPMATMRECEWVTCDECAAKCEHEYERGMIHGSGLEMGVGEFCGKCGRGKPPVPGEREKTPIEHQLAVEKELGIKVLYKNGPPTTPREFVKVSRMVRRYRKSKRSQLVH